MPRVTEIKVGSVFLKEVKPRKWKASWTDPLTKRHTRRMLPATEYREAERMAKDINSKVAQGRGFGGRLRGSDGHTVSAAVIEAIKHTNANGRSRHDYLFYFNPFAEYLSTRAKGVQAWSDVTEPVLQNYIEYCRQKKIAHDTLRLRLFVLRLTAAHMSRTYPDQYRNTAAGLRLRRMDPPKAQIDAEEAILKPEQLHDLLEWLRFNERMVNVWASLQGLCGLRLFEAIYLPEQDFDPIAKTITITESSAHKPKNRASYRVIPVCGEVARTLTAWIQSLKVRHPEGYLFTPSKVVRSAAKARSKEVRAGALRGDYVSSIWSDAVDRAQEHGVATPGKFTPRRLRASFVTAMRTAGADFEILQRYIGHTPTSILSAHYDHVSIDRLRSIATLSQELFEQSGAFTKRESDPKAAEVLH